jgi:hypothetical protein
MDHLDVAKMLDAKRVQLIDRTVELALENPFWMERFGPGFTERLVLDSDANIAALAKGVRYRSPMLLDDHMIWRRNQILGFGCSTGHAREIWSYKWQAINEQMPPDMLFMIYEYIQSAMNALSYTAPAIREISHAQDGMAELLIAASYDQQWHWQAAYGLEGRPQALRDAWFLFDYAIDSLGRQNNEILGRYVRSQRHKLVSCGLSTMHMRQLLWLATQVAEQQLAPGPASELSRAFQAANGYLSHDKEACAALQAAQEQIVGEVAHQIVAAGMAPQAAIAAVEVGWYLAYIDDGIEADNASGLVSYTRWIQHWLAEQGLPDTPLRQSYAAIDRALDRHLPQYAVQHARSILSAAQRML